MNVNPRSGLKLLEEYHAKKESGYITFEDNNLFSLYWS